MLDTCPPFTKFFQPLLRLASAGEINVRESANKIADEFDLSAQARLETTKSGNQRRYIDRTHWAAIYLFQAGLLATTRRGFVSITPDGQSFFESQKEDILVNDLRSLPAFIDFQNRKGTRAHAGTDKQEDEFALTPLDKITEALEEIEDSLAAELLDQLQSSSPDFFEKVIVDLLLSIGYGGDDDNAGQVLGKSGDNGVDGLINQDILGLESVYIQAKRYQSDSTISSEAVRSFTGALNVQQAQKGLFVTTSSFSKSAKETAEKVPQRIVLIDGDTLSRLMIKHGDGCVSQKTLEVKKLNADYFE